MTTLIRSSAVGRSHYLTRLSRLLDVLTLHRSRRSLAALDDHMLRDIGLTREQAQAEAERAVWDVPAGWRR